MWPAILVATEEEASTQFWQKNLGEKKSHMQDVHQFAVFASIQKLTKNFLLGTDGSLCMQ